MPSQLLWFCHVSLGIAAVGFLVKSKLLKATALTNVLVLHAMWIVDFISGYTVGIFPIAVSEYVREVTFANWLATLYHLYLLPLLLWSWRREREYPIEAWLVSATTFVLIVLASRGLCTPAENVNYAYYLPEPHARFGLIVLNELTGDLYLLALHGIVNVLMFLPAVIILSRGFQRLRGRSGAGSASSAACRTVTA